MSSESTFVRRQARDRLYGLTRYLSPRRLASVILTAGAFAACGVFILEISNSGLLNPPASSSQPARLGQGSRWELQPEPPSNEDNQWKEHNIRVLGDLVRCTATGTCSEHQQDVVVLADPDYKWAHVGVPGGERIWSSSVLSSLDRLGFTYVFAENLEGISLLYTLIPNFIRVALVPWLDIKTCLENWDCYRSSWNPRGVRIQELFHASFFGMDNVSPFGSEWMLVPEDFGKQWLHIGYSVEDTCSDKIVPAYSEKPRQVWVLAKYRHYFDAWNTPYNPDVFTEAAEALNIEFVGAYDEEGKGAWPGVRNLKSGGGLLDKPGFERELARSLAIVGLGDPIMSPTPWFGLCWGVPFLNPLKDKCWEKDLKDASLLQHSHFGKLGEPHSYSVLCKDNAQFIEQLRQAIEPHEPYIPPIKGNADLDARVLGWVTRNWTERVEQGIAEGKDKWASVIQERKIWL